MNHRDAGRHLADHACGRLPADLAVELDRHLARCAECREWLATYRGIVAGLAPAAVDGHPTSERMAAWAAGQEATPPEAVAHFESCASCRMEIGVLRGALEAARAETPEALAAAEGTSIGRRWVVAAAVAAGILLLVVVGGRFKTAPEAAGPAHVTLAGSLTGEERIVAGSIDAAGVRIERGSRIALEAESLVTFGDGFAVDSGATFEVGGKSQGGV